MSKFKDANASKIELLSILDEGANPEAIIVALMSRLTDEEVGKVVELYFSE